MWAAISGFPGCSSSKKNIAGRRWTSLLTYPREIPMWRTWWHRRWEPTSLKTTKTRSSECTRSYLTIRAWMHTKTTTISFATCGLSIINATFRIGDTALALLKSKLTFTAFSPFSTISAQLAPCDLFPHPIGNTGNRLLKKFSIINIYTSKQTNFSIQASKFKIQTNSSASNFGIKLYLT